MRKPVQKVLSCMARQPGLQPVTPPGHTFATSPPSHEGSTGATMQLCFIVVQCSFDKVVQLFCVHTGDSCNRRIVVQSRQSCLHGH